PDLGGATVYTNTRAGLAGECPNLGTFLNNLSFTLAMENEIMGAILDDGQDPEEAAMGWLKANADAAMAWVDGVTTADGGDAAAALGAMLAE
ncbi:MAG: glycine betaine ABC transporter substrate-binding protein, partial [Pseudomonadota bacterium]